MGDSWDDDNYEVPDLASNLAALSLPVVEEVDEAITKPKKALPIVKTAGVLKKQQQEAEALARKMESSMLNNETTEERKARERKQVEEADAELSRELFRGQVRSEEVPLLHVLNAANVPSIPLKTIEDHAKLGLGLGLRLADSSAFHLNAFYQSLVPALKQSRITFKMLDDLIRELQEIRNEKALTESAAQPAPVKKSKKELMAEYWEDGEFYAIEDKFRFNLAEKAKLKRNFYRG
eukprot:scaffold5398_cov240-Ochromonas_danica.AAC.5